MDFVERVTLNGEIDDEWSAYVDAKREAELTQIIDEQGLKAEPTRAFIDEAFRDGQLRTGGTAITTILPPVSRFSAGGGHGNKKQAVVDALTRFFDRFFGLGSSETGGRP